MNRTNHLYTIATIFFGLLATVTLIKCTSKKERRINYLSQKPPGNVAELFAPGLVTTDSMEHSAPAFSPDGSVVLWTVLNRAYRAFILEMKYEKGKWSAPYRPSFADSTADDYYPSFSPDGKKLYFSSRRKCPPAYPGNIDMRIWEVEKTEKGWGNPVPFDTIVSQGHEYAHCITSNGTLYFSSPHEVGTSLNIYKAEKNNGHYTKPLLLPYNINSISYEDGVFVAPDESFLIFESNRPEGTDGGLDLYISFKAKNGQWGIPVNMGPEINSRKAERFARLSPDGKYLFFGSGGNQSANNTGFDIYWIDAKVIDELRNNETAKTVIAQPLGNKVMEALYKNDFESAAGLIKQWLRLYPNSQDAIVRYSVILRKEKKYAEAEQFLANTAMSFQQNTGIILERSLVKFGTDKCDEAVKLLTPILTKGDQLQDRCLYLSNALFEMQKFTPSDEYFEKAMSVSPHSVAYYNRACKYALIGERGRAFKALNKAVKYGGYNVRRDYENDPDLRSLQSDARWKVLSGKLK